MPTLLITGGAGYLGEEVARQASALGWQVAATYHTRRPALAGVDWLALDIRDAPAVERMWRAVRPAIVIHTAYRQGGPELVPVTVAGSEHVARASRAVGARLVHLSSDALFDGELPPGQRYSEADDPSPITPYGAAKAAAERLVEQLLPEALIVRTSLIYGGAQPGQHERFILDALQGQAEVAFFSDELRCPIALADLAAALLELAPGAQQGRLHIAGPEVVSRYTFACAVAAAHGHDPARLRAGLSAASGMRRPRNCALDSRLAERLLRTRLRGLSAVLQHHLTGPHE